MHARLSRPVASLLIEIMAIVALGLWCLLAFPGCTPGRNRLVKEPRASAQAGALNLAQTGDAATPANAAHKETKWETFIPAGVEVTAWTDGRVTWTPRAPLPLSASVAESSATGPAAFTPPAPPSPSDEADGKARLWMRLGLVAGVAAGVFGLIRGWDWVAVGGGAIAAGCLVGMALARIPAWLWAVFGLGAAACVIGPVIWHTRLKPRPPSPSPAP